MQTILLRRTKHTKLKGEPIVKLPPREQQLVQQEFTPTVGAGHRYIPSGFACQVFLSQHLLFCTECLQHAEVLLAGLCKALVGHTPCPVYLLCLLASVNLCTPFSHSPTFFVHPNLQEAAFYREVQEQSMKAMQAADSQSSSSAYVNMLYSLLKLRQACNHPWLVKGVGPQAPGPEPTAGAPKGAGGTSSGGAGRGRGGRGGGKAAAAAAAAGAPGAAAAAAAKAGPPAAEVGAAKKLPAEQRARLLDLLRHPRRSALCAGTCLRTRASPPAATCTASSAWQDSWRAQVRGLQAHGLYGWEVYLAHSLRICQACVQRWCWCGSLHMPRVLRDLLLTCSHF